MKLDSLIGESLKGVGLRFNLVGLLPLAVLSVFVLVLAWSGAFTGSPDLSEAVQEAVELATADAVLLVIAVLALAVILQPLQLSLVRCLEGYWGGGWIGGFLSQVGVSRHRARRRRLEAATRTTREVTEAERRRMSNAAWQLRRSYPSEPRLLPTTLGNVLRAAEDRAGGRYGLDAVVVWPRLYPLLPEGVTSVLADQRNQLDLTARFCVVFLAGAVLSLVALLGDGWWLTVPCAALLLAWLAYRSSVAAAAAYGETIQSAFDLHRFDLLEALHLSLPADRESERKANRELSDFLRQGLPINLRYSHPDREED